MIANFVAAFLDVAVRSDDRHSFDKVFIALGIRHRRMSASGAEGKGWLARGRHAGLGMPLAT